MPCECHNSDAEHEIAIANVAKLAGIRGLIAQVFSLPGVEDALCNVYGNQLADAIEVLGERGEL